MDQITDPAEQQQIIHSANCFYRLYGDIFRTLTPEHGIAKLQPKIQAEIAGVEA
jgi:hypothetical protein